MTSESECRAGSTDEQTRWTGGIAVEEDFVLAAPPANPELLESSNFWIFADDGSVAFPRIDVEASGEHWHTPGVQVNMAMADGRLFFDPQEEYHRISPIGADGKPRILGTERMRMELVEPFRKWRAVYDGEVIATDIDALVARSINLYADDTGMLPRVPLKFEVEMDMAVPCLAQNNPEEKLQFMSAREQADAKAMGIGWRVEQLFRGRGSYTLGGQRHEFACTGLRVRRRSYRPLGGFRGHCWQSALFPDGRGFGYCTYLPGEDGSTFNEGYVYVDGRMYPATAKTVPWFKEKVAEGENVSVELESELGVTRISGKSKFNTFKEFVFGPGSFTFNQGGALLEWDGQRAYGMMERSFFQERPA